MVCVGEGGGGGGAADGARGPRGARRTALPTRRRTPARTVPGLAGEGAPHWALFALDGHRIQVEREEAQPCHRHHHPRRGYFLSISLHRNAAILPHRIGKKGGGRRNRSYAPRHGRGSRGRGGRRRRRWRWAYRGRMRGLRAGLTGHPTRSPPPPTTSVRRDKKTPGLFLALSWRHDVVRAHTGRGAEGRGRGRAATRRTGSRGGVPRLVEPTAGSWSRRTAVPPGLLTPPGKIWAVRGAGWGGGGQRA